MADSSIPFPGRTKGPTPATPPPVMDEMQRKLWLAAKGAPPNMVLATIQELDQISGTLVTQTLLIKAQQQGERSIIAQLGDYWKTEPDIVNAVASAVFDAQRYKKGTELVEPTLRRLADKLERIVKSTGMNPVVIADLLEIGREITERADTLKHQRDLRRERIKAEPKPTK